MFVLTALWLFTALACYEQAYKDIKRYRYIQGANWFLFGSIWVVASIYFNLPK